MLIAGTGAACIAVDATGARRADGWGPLLGDEGSGGRIGREGLRAVVRAHDGRGPRTALLELAVEVYAVEIDELPATVTEARGCGRFAPSVARAAADGDEVAADTVGRAGAALADTVHAAMPDGGPLVVVGGLLNLGGLLWKPLRDNSTIEWRQPLGDAMDGARLLLDNTSTVHEPAVRRA